MVVATYNLRNANGGDSTNGNGWGANAIPTSPRSYNFTGSISLVPKRANILQLQDLRQAMPGYDYIGVGRDDGKRAGEHSAIFYRTDKFEVLEHGDFWLSEITDRPNKAGMPSFPVSVRGVSSGISKPVSLSCSSTFTWTM